MSTSKEPDLFVLDTLANDVESVEDVLRMLNSESDVGWVKEWGRPFTREDVISALSRLVREDLVRAYAEERDGSTMRELPARSLPAAGFSDTYFGMTARGRLVHRNWNPEIASGGDSV